MFSLSGFVFRSKPPSVYFQCSAYVYKYSKNQSSQTQLLSLWKKSCIYKNSLNVSTNNFIIRRNCYNSIYKKAELVLKEASLVYNFAILVTGMKINNIARISTSRENLLLK